jgi:maleate isomerase
MDLKDRRNPNIGLTKVGLILPSVNCIIEPEFYAVAPPGISFHSTRVLLTETTPEALMRMEEDLDQAARLLETINPRAVVYACTSGSFVKGLGWDRSIIEKIESIVGCPAMTTSTAMAEALRVMDIRRVGLVTPYLDSVNEREVDFLKKSGFEVVNWKGLGLSGRAIREQPPERVYQLAKDVDTPRADGLFISCTDFRAMEVIEILEKDLGKPVLSSNQVTLWALLKILNHPGRVKGYGRLLAEML